MSEVTPPKVIVTSLTRSTLILTNTHIFTFGGGYGHQVLAAATPLREESSSHRSLGTSNVITMQLRDLQI